MAYKDTFDFCQKAEEYAQTVAAHLAQHIGESNAAIRVLQRLSIVLQDMAEGGRPDDMATVLIPKSD